MRSLASSDYVARPVDTATELTDKTCWLHIGSKGYKIFKPAADGLKS